MLPGKPHACRSLIYRLCPKHTRFLPGAEWTYISLAGLFFFFLTSCSGPSRDQTISVSLLSDPNRNVDFSLAARTPESQFTPVTSPGGTNPGFSTGRYYLKLVIPPGEERLRILIQNPFLERVDFLAVERGQTIAGLPDAGTELVRHAGLRGDTGDIYPSLVVDPSRISTVWIRLDSRTPYRIPLHLALESEWQMQDFLAGIVPALVGGAALTLLLYHLFLWRLTGDRSSLIFLPYLALVTFHRLVYHGPAALLFKQSFPDALLPVSLMATTGGTLVLLFWALTFLRRLGHGPAMTLITRTALLPAILLFLSSPFFPYETNLVVYITAVPYTLYLTLLGFTAARAGFHPGMYFGLSCLSFPAAILIQLAYTIGWIPGPFAADYALDAAFLVQMLLMALAIADRMRSDIRTSQESLESEVHERTAELRGEVLARTLAQKEAEQANQARSLFLANISHEIRTPMNVILGTNDLFSETTNLTAEQRAWLASMRRAGLGLLNILDDILQTSKLELGRVQLEEKTFRLREWLTAFVEPFSARVREEAVTFSMSIADEVPGLVRGDPDRLAQVLSNLLSNAIKFTEAGAVRLRTTSETMHNRSVLLFEVEDTGPGIQPDDMPHIFDPFSPASGRTVARYGGTGLGLSIARALARLMGGDLQATSTPGSGSRFLFSVPLAVVPESPLRSANPSYMVLPVSILLVEDQAENRLLFERYLRGHVRDFTFAEDGAQAVTLFQKGNFDLVFMDIRMPVMDGYGALRALRTWEIESGRTAVPILALTAHAVESETLKIRQAGFTEILTKPIRRDDLLQAIERHVTAFGNAR